MSTIPRPTDVPAEGRTIWTAEALAARLNGRWINTPSPNWTRSRVQWVRDPAKVDYGNINIIPMGHARKVRTWWAPNPQAAGCLIMSEQWLQPDFKTNVPLLLVEKVVEALGQLATTTRERVTGTIVAVTGTVGKTTTQKMLVHILRGFGSLVANDRNLRLEVFEDLANANANADYLLFELGMGEYHNALGQVTAIVKPHASVLTQLGVAHIDLFPKTASDEDILGLVLGQKLQIFSHGPALGVLNSDIALFDKAHAAVASMAGRVLTAGKSPIADVRLISLDHSGGGTTVTANVLGQEVRYRLQSEAGAVVANSLTALACVVGLGCDLHKAAERLETFVPVPGRARVHPLTIDAKNIRIVDDSFNATPLSFASCLDHLNTLAAESGGRKIAVLGDIAHLGHRSAQIHAGLASQLVQNGVDRVYTMGDQAKHLHEAAPPVMRAGHFSEHKDLIEALVRDLRENDTIAVKASMPLRFVQIVRSLRAMSSTDLPA